MNFELLLEAVEMAEELQIPSTFVETNCYWCTSDKTADERLKRLKEAGLKGILISVNPYYAEFVPFERTERCIEHSLRVFGENVAVYQLEYYRRFKQLGIKKRISVEEYAALTRDESLAYHVETFLMGRATQALRGFYPSYSASCFFDRPCQPPFVRNWHNHFDNYGNYMPGFCGGISLGNWYEMDKLTGEGIELEERPVLKFLVEDDFKGLYRFAERSGYRESQEGYLSKCDLCLDIRKFLVTQSHFDELQPREFYEFAFDQK
jgi:DNA-binding Lrp family transcriptional regulator